MAQPSCFAALLASIEERLLLNSERVFLVFPRTRRAYARSDVLFDRVAFAAHNPGVDPEVATNENLAGFSELVNDVQEEGPFLDDRDRPIWVQLETLVTSSLVEIAAARPELRERFAKQSAALAPPTRRSDPRPGSDTQEFMLTSTRRPLEDMFKNDAWSVIALDGAGIAERAPRVSALGERWLTTLGLHEAPFGEDVRVVTVSMEMFAAPVQRTWLDEELLTHKGWRWPEEALSDGAMPPRGRLPAYVIEIIFARRLKIELAAETGGVAKAPSNLTGLTMKSAIGTPTTERTSLRELRKTTTASTSSAAKVGSSDAFSVPPQILAPQFRTAIEEALQRCAGERSTAQAALDTTNAQVAELHARVQQLEEQAEILKRELSELPRHPRPRRPISPALAKKLADLGREIPEFEDPAEEKRIALAGLNAEIEQARTGFAAFEPTLATQRQQIADLDGRFKKHTDDLAALSLWDREPDPESIFLLGFVCRALPKSPDPDPSLFP